MKKFTLLIVTLSLVFTSSSLFAFSKEVTAPTLVQSGKHKHWCPVCGMDIKKFYKTSHTSILPNGKNRQYCSMRCLAVDMLEYKIDNKTIKVVEGVKDKLKEANSSAYSITTNSLDKVYVGPEFKREVSNKMREEIKTTFNLTGIVVKYSVN